MKQNFFYSHLIETTDISIRLTEMDLTKDEKVHLTSLLEANIHSTIVHNILSELSEEVNNKHQKTLDHLGAKIEKLEDKIKKSVEDLKKELLKDLVQAQKN
jgi:acetate kinase